MLPGLGKVEDVSGGIFAIIEPVALLTILLAVLRRWKGWSNLEVPRSLKIFFLLFLITFLFSNFISFVFRGLGYFPDIDIEGPQAFKLFMEIPYGLIFLFGVMVFIKERLQVEKIFFIIMLGGISIGVQAIMFFYMKLFPFLHTWAINGSGRFTSLTFIDFDAVGLFSVISIGCSAYFYFSGVRRRLAFSAIALNFISIITTVERAPLVATFISLCTIGWFYAKGGYRLVFVYACGVIIIIFLFFEQNSFILRGITFLGAGIREDYRILNLYSRFDLGVKGINVFYFSFPFGVGSGLVQFFIGEATTQRFIIRMLPYVSDTHNYFISHIAEYGFLGIVTLFLFVSTIVRNFRTWRERSRNMEIYTDKWSAMISIYAIFCGSTFYFVFENTPKFLHLFLMFFYFTYLPVSIMSKDGAKDIRGGYVRDSRMRAGLREKN
jgi:hypothetical protein